MRFASRGGGGRGFGGGGRRFGGRSGGFGGRRESFDREDDNTPKPVKVGEEYDVEISEVGSKGDGIARVKNFVVFVNGATQGEKTRIKITDVRGRFAIGEKVSGSGSSEGAAEGTGETEATTSETATEESPAMDESEEEKEEG